MTEKEAKKTIIDIGKRMYNAGYVAANDGNISVRISKNEVIATPSGVSKGFMDEDMLVRVNLEGQLIEGKRKPSSELRMHLAAYRNNDSIKSVCHAHPPISTSFGVAGIPYDKPITAEMVLTLGEVPIVPYERLGSDELADSIIPYVNSHGAVILANHGVVTWGEDPYTAYYRMESMEHYGKMYMITKQLGNANVLEATAVEDLIGQREKFGINITARPKMY